LFGRWEGEAKIGGDKFKIVNIKAIAEYDDILGRKPGEALWPERVPLARLEGVKKTRPRWFKACWQGEPDESKGLHFQPKEWPTYTDIGDAWRIFSGLTWYVYRKVDCEILQAVDWAQAGKKDSNKTAIVTAAITTDGKLLILNVFSDHLRYEENAPALDVTCKTYSTYDGHYLNQIVASDDDMLSDAMAVECRRYKNIPEIKRLDIRSRSKIIRAQAAIIRSQNALFFLPAEPKMWYEECCDHLASFTGADGAEDDIADCFGILGRLADDFAPGDMVGDFDLPVLGSGGYEGIDGGW
jgi:hypothetical protein